MTLRKTLFAAVAALALLAGPLGTARAGVSIGVGVGFPLFVPRCHHRPHVYVAPPAVVVVPRPVYVAPAPADVAPPATPGYVTPVPYPPPAN